MPVNFDNVPEIHNTAGLVNVNTQNFIFLLIYILIIVCPIILGVRFFYEYTVKSPKHSKPL